VEQESFQKRPQIKQACVNLRNQWSLVRSNQRVDFRFQGRNQLNRSKAHVLAGVVANANEAVVLRLDLDVVSGVALNQ
jgi:hypothetical protein